jgi:argininosuccinate lyase
MALAKTDASGGSGLLPEVLAFSTSLGLDRQLLKEDLLGSMAHVTMLGRTGVIPAKEARVIRDGLVDLWKRDDAGTLVLPDEEDVHMAVEVELNRTIGAPAALLHSARSRNDQVATDLRLHVRDSVATAIGSLTQLIEEVVERAKKDGHILMPSYTHRQRAQPISLGYWLASYGAAFLRDAQAFTFALDQADALALGSGAISGSSLAIDREVTRGLLGFSRLTMNGLDTVGERDFALDYLYSTARFFVHASRLSTDLIDFTTSEFGFATLSGDISMGSSMMPQKKNPDVFELIRGKSGRAIGNLMGLLTTVKGLPGGYNRDLQEDRGPAARDEADAARRVVGAALLAAARDVQRREVPGGARRGLHAGDRSRRDAGEEGHAVFAWRTNTSARSCGSARSRASRCRRPRSSWRSRSIPPSTPTCCRCSRRRVRSRASRAPAARAQRR